MAHIFNPCPRDRARQISVSSWSAWSTKRVPRWPGLHRETMSQNAKQINQQTTTKKKKRRRRGRRGLTSIKDVKNSYGNLLLYAVHMCVFFMRRVLIGIPEITDRQKLSAKCGGWLPMSWLLVMHILEEPPSPQTKQHKLWPLLLIRYQKVMVRPTAEDTPYLRHRTWKVRLLLPRKSPPCWGVFMEPRGAGQNARVKDTNSLTQL